MMEAAVTSETSVDFCQTTRFNSPEYTAVRTWNLANTGIFRQILVGVKLIPVLNFTEIGSAVFEPLCVESQKDKAKLVE
jgi:hypothetical protein